MLTRMKYGFWRSVWRNQKFQKKEKENEYNKFLEVYSCIHVQEPGELSLAEVASFITEEESDPD